MNIIEVMEDLQLLGKQFQRGPVCDSWKSWRVFLAAVFGLGMDEEALELFRTHTGRSDAPTTAFNEGFVIVGRRGGKSIIAALVATYLACFKDYSATLAIGEVGVLMVIASDRRQARTIMRYIRAFIESSPLLAQMVVADRKESISLNNRVVIEIHTCSFKATRGYTLIGVIADEVAFWSTENSASPGTEVLNALRPGLATTNGLLLAISSPYSRRGELWRNFKNYYGKESDVLVWKGSSREMNPSLSQAVVAEAYLRDAASARAEFGGEFRSDIEGFLSQEVVEAVVVPHRFELPYNPQRTCVGFVDPSGGASDAMTLGIAHWEAEKAVLDVVREVPPPFSPESVVAKFAGLLKAYHIHEVTGDAYSGEWVREQFQKCGVLYRVSEMNRSEIYLEFLAAMMSGRVELLDHKKLVSQLCGLERRTGRGGRDSIDHGPGGHDDVANACAGALVRALGSMGNYGLLEYFSKLQSGEIPFPQEQIAVQRNWREELGEWQYKGRTLQPSNPERSKAKSLPPCEKCSGTVVQLGGAQRCQACGYQPDEGTYIVASRSTDGRPIFREVKHARARIVRNDT